MKRIRQLLTAALASALLLPPACCLAGCRQYAVVSASMVPAIPVGSCVFVYAVPFDGIREQSVITYCLGNGIPVTHRVIARNALRQTFVTKGDANEQPDASEIPYGQVIGKVIFSIPCLGYALIFLQGTCGRILLAGAAFAAVMSELFLIDRKRKRGEL